MRQQIKLCREWLCVLCFCHHKSCSSAIFICEKKRSYVFIKHLDQQASQYHLVNNHPFLKLGGRRMLFWDRTFITTYKYMYNSSWSSWSTVCNDAHLCRLQEHGSHIQYPMPPAQPLSTFQTEPGRQGGFLRLQCTHPFRFLFPRTPLPVWAGTYPQHQVSSGWELASKLRCTARQAQLVRQPCVGWTGKIQRTHLCPIQPSSTLLQCRCWRHNRTAAGTMGSKQATHTGAAGR